MSEERLGVAMGKIQSAIETNQSVSVDVPTTGWYASQSVVPTLKAPHELFALSNRPLVQVPASTPDAHMPLIEELDPAAFFVWGYYEVLCDPWLGLGPTICPPIPEYGGRFSYPFVYSDSEVFPSQNAFDWSPTDFVWRRLGRDLPPTTGRTEPAALTVMVWEGTQSTLADTQAAIDIVASIALAP